MLPPFLPLWMHRIAQNPARKLISWDLIKRMFASFYVNSMDHNPRHDEAVQGEKIRMVLRNTRMILLGNMLGCLPMVVVLYSKLPVLVCLWVGGLYLVLGARLVHLKQIDIYKEPFSRLIIHHHQQVWLILLTGCVWGCAGWIFFDAGDPGRSSLMILTLVTMIAGSLVSLSSQPLSYLLFSVSLMLPLLARLLSSSEVHYNWLGFGGMVYVAATLVFSRTIHKVIDRAFRLRYENQELVEDLKQQTERANKANEEKSRFLAAASHDLRQPLQAVCLYSEVLAGKLDQDDQKQDLSNIQQGLDSLNGLLDSLFDVSRLDSGVIVAHRVVFELDDIFHKVENQFQLEAHLRGLAFDVRYAGVCVYSDPVLLERVMANLLANAFRYTEKGRIDVRFSCHSKTSVSVHIRDTGIGIGKDELKRIFEEFYQVYNPERDRRHGLGLGLAIVRRIIKLLGHQITVTSAQGQGSEFTVTLPAVERVENHRTAVIINDRVVHTLNGMIVMIVDNEKPIVEAMGELLTSWGAVSLICMTPESALDSLDEGKIPDFLIADYRMPGRYNGIELIDAARSRIPGLPALLITGDTSTEVLEEFQQRQLDYLHKPVRPPQLRMMIRRILKR
jgi:two-component system, sensor histidine kinase